MVRRFATPLQVVGAVLLAGAGWAFDPVLGVAVAGVGFLAFGLAAERKD